MKVKKETKKVRKERRKRCSCCDHLYSVLNKEIHFVADPYNSEINHDNTEVWICNDCYIASCENM